MNALIYDIEIKKAICGRKERPIEGIEYCAGFHDHANMGISCIGAYDYVEDRYRVFMDDNMAEFSALANDRSLIVTFNGIAFDNAVCAANNISVPAGRDYDLLVEAWAAAGFGPKFDFNTHAGFGLDACGKANFGQSKTGNGAHAPVDFQRKRYGSLIDYCLNDVALTKKLFDRVIATGAIQDPRDSSKSLPMRHPLHTTAVDAVPEVVYEAAT